jgi:hypothetical protein
VSSSAVGDGAVILTLRNDMTHILTGHRAVIHFFHLLLFDVATFAFDIDGGQMDRCHNTQLCLARPFFLNFIPMYSMTSSFACFTCTLGQPY